MRVLLFHPTVLPPKDYGGVERVVLWLASGLRDRGHEVIVAACPGSRLPAGVRLWEVSPDQSHAQFIRAHLPRGLDLVHFMAPPGDAVWKAVEAPALLTVHGNGKAGERFPVNTVFLSADHARRHNARAYVHNGIDPAEYRFNPATKGRALAFLSKTSWKVKNLRGAIRRSLRAGVHLEIAGGSRPYSLRALSCLHPRLRWIGPVANERKAEFLARARALVFPVIWPEPFGLVVAESLMSGTPVIASRLGSLPELIAPETGKLVAVDDEEAWVETLRTFNDPYSPEACREHAFRNFHFAKMSESYETIYRKVAAGERLHEVAPRAENERTGL